MFKEIVSLQVVRLFGSFDLIKYVQINLCFGWADVVCPNLTLVFALIGICDPTLLKFDMAVNKIKA